MNKNHNKNVQDFTGHVIIETILAFEKIFV